MSDTPPFQWEEPVQTEQVLDTTVQNSCISKDLIPPEFSKKENLEAINIKEITKNFENAINKIFPEAKITQTDTYINNNQFEAINCVVISPLKAIEETAFDLIIGKPEIVEEYFNFPNIETRTSEVINLIQNLGDSRSAFHIEVPGKNIQIETIIYRQNEKIFIINFISNGSEASQQKLIEIATKLE
jgi:hypothetical protein